MQVHDILVEAYQNGDVYLGFWNAVAAIGGSLISGLFGSKKTKTESTSTSSVNFKQLAKDAIAGGFNPLTALRSGAIGGYVTTKSSGSQSGGGPSIGAAVGDAIAGAGQMGLFGSMPKYDPIKTKSLTSGRVSSTVAGQIFGGSSRSGSVVVAPRQTTVSSPVTKSQPALGRKLAPYLEDGKLTNTDVGKQTTWWESDPNRVDGAQYEDAYGEFVGGVLGGIIPLGQDLWHNGKRAADYGSAAWERQKVSSNYRTMAKRPWVNRPAPPKGYRYAN